LIDVEDFMLDRQEELEEQKAARTSRARREERSPSPEGDRLVVLGQPRRQRIAQQAQSLESTRLRTE
jgi:hypothetical protein